MQNYSVISKGACGGPRNENFVYVISYLFIRQEGKKYLLLKLKNARAEAVDGVNLKVTLLDKKGQTLSVLHLSSDKGAEGNTSFAFGEKIEADEACVDFIARVESAVYGGYLYKEENGAVSLDYDAAEHGGFDVNTVKASMRGKTRTVTEKRLGVPVAVSILACLLLVCAVLVTYFQLKSFMDNATGFTYSGVEYVFADADKTPGSEIIVTGYRGTKSNVLIPEKIDGYVVSEIRDSAFEGNAKIERLKIEGEVKIGAYAFADCKNLTSVTMGNVSKVGDCAFSGCDCLLSVEISGGDEVELGEYAFKNCTSLSTVKIQKQIIYPENSAVFDGADRIEELYLQNYGNGTISDLFGGKATTSLKDLTIIYLDGICDYFCYWFNYLERVTVSYIDGESYSIGNYAFNGTKLTTLKIPQGLSSVGDYAFSGTELVSFNAYGVESMGEYAFSYCAQLKSFTVPESLTALSCGTFSGCSSLESVIFEGEELNEIGADAFYGCESLESIEIPDSVVKIGSWAFSGCTNLKSLTLPYLGSSADAAQTADYLFGSTEVNLKSITLTSATTLAAQAFYGCSLLEEVNLNEGLEYIGSYAFMYCMRLKNIVIPSSVSAVGYEIFEGCFRLFEVYNLSGVEVNCNYALAVYSSLDQSIPKAERNGYTVAYTDGSFAQPEGWYLIDYPEDRFYTLPEGFLRVTSYSIPDYLFYNETDIINVFLSDGVASLGRYAFYGCSSLKSCRFSRSVTSIGDYAFAYSSLVYLSLSESVSKIGDNAFQGCCFLKEVTISGSDVAVGNYAFYNCPALTSVFINGVKSIGEWAFYCNYALERVEILRADGYIGGFAFCGCSSLTETVIPEGVTKIGVSAFSDCANLREVTLPKSLIEIGSNAFQGCSRLRAVVNYSPLVLSNNDENGGVGRLAIFIVTNAADADNLFYDESEGVTFLHLYRDLVAVWCDDGVTELNFSALSGYDSLKIASNAFSDNGYLKSADLGGVSAIGENAFYSCYALERATLGKNLTEIGDNAFSGCVKLQSVNLQDTRLNVLGEGAFYGCMSLTQISLPRTLTEIPGRAFGSCGALSDAVIPQSISFIGSDAFFGCTALLQVHNLSRLTMLAGSTDNGFCAYYALYVFTDAESKMTFAEKDGYKFANYNQGWYLYGCTNYDFYKKLPESFTFENSTVSSYIIREGAFSSATYLIIPTAVTKVEENAFYSASALYYCGTSAQWEAVRPVTLGFTRVYFYSPCIHTDDGNLWTYNSNGYPVISQSALVWTVTGEATCVNDGVRTGVCPECGITRTEVIEKLYHTLGADGKCGRCGAQGEYVKNLSGLFDGYSVSSSAFNLENGSFVTKNASASMTITATEDMQVFFSCYVSSYYDKLTITAGGEVIAQISSYVPHNFIIELSKGQSLIFSYNKSLYISSDGATVSYILIFA